MKDIVETKGKIGIFTILKGGSGSGNFGHEGRPGQVGGSGEGGEGASDIGIPIAVYNQSKKEVESLIDRFGVQAKLQVDSSSRVMGINAAGDVIGLPKLDKDETEDAWRSRFLSKEALGGGSLEETIRHEYGHVIENKFPFKIEKETEPLYRQHASRISSRAEDSRREFFAETFMKYASGSKLPKDVKDYMVKLEDFLKKKSSTRYGLVAIWKK
jgi:hypothetical protein